MQTRFQISSIAMIAAFVVMACAVASGQSYQPAGPVYPLQPGAPTGPVPQAAGYLVDPSLSGSPGWIQPLPPTGPLLQPSPLAPGPVAVPGPVPGPPPEPVEVIPVEADQVEIEAPPFWHFDPWTGGFEIGLNGSEGNSQTFALHFGVEGNRKTPYGELSLELTYSKGTNDGIESEHEALFDGRHEWQWKKSPWTAFLHGTGEYDEFRAFDVRASVDSGLGYVLVDAEATKLTARVGGGTSREIGGPDDRFVPEGLAGLEFKYQLSKRQKLLFSVEYFPDVTEMGDYRANSKAAWEMLVDPEMNLNLKLSVTDRYDSTPNGAKRNDLDYSLLLLWTY